LASPASNVKVRRETMALNPFEQLQLLVPEPRQAFEDIAALILRAIVPGSRRVRVYRGDGGVDVYEGNYGTDAEVDVYQIKYFPDPWGDAQKQQIRDSYRTARHNSDYNLKRWSLCVPVRLTKEDIRWFDEWRRKQDKAIEIVDGDDLAADLQEDRCAAARNQLRDWGVRGVGAAGPRFSARAVVRKQHARTGLLYQIVVLLSNVGDATARNLRILVTHTETNCVAGGINGDWWHQPSGDSRVNPWNLHALHDLNPSEHVPVLGINICDRTPVPFSIGTKIWAQDVMPTELHVILTSEELRDGVTVELASGKPSNPLGTANRENQESVPQPTSPAAKEMLELILKHPNSEERGLTEILEGDPANHLNAAFLPTAATHGSAQVLTARKRSFNAALSELLELGWLLPPEENARVRIYELNPDAAG